MCFLGIPLTQTSGTKSLSLSLSLSLSITSVRKAKRFSHWPDVGHPRLVLPSSSVFSTIRTVAARDRSHFMGLSYFWQGSDDGWGASDRGLSLLEAVRAPRPCHETGWRAVGLQFVSASAHMQVSSSQKKLSHNKISTAHENNGSLPATKKTH